MFKPVLVGVAAASLAMGVAQAPRSPFVGSWRLVGSRSRMPDEMKVQSKGGNTYAFDFGGGTETIVVDGSDQPGVGGSLLSVKAEAGDTWTVKRKKGGRLLLKATWKLSRDGSTLRDYYREFESDGSTTSLDYVYRRAGRGAGFAGDWQSIKETVNSPFVLEVKELPGDSLSIADPLVHTTRDLKLDDPAGAKGSASAGPKAGGGVSSSLRRVDERTLVITDRHNGKEVATEDFVLSLDLNLLTMTVRVAARPRPYVLVFERI